MARFLILACIFIVLVGCGTAYIEPQDGEVAYINLLKSGPLSSPLQFIFLDSKECRQRRAILYTPANPYAGGLDLSNLKVPANKELSFGLAYSEPEIKYPDGRMCSMIVTFTPQSNRNYNFTYSSDGDYCQIGLEESKTSSSSPTTSNNVEHFRKRTQTTFWMDSEPGCKPEGT